VNMVLNFFSTC